jgi:hypothetical protein
MFSNNADFKTEVGLDMVGLLIEVWRIIVFPFDPLKSFIFGNCGNIGVAADSIGTAKEVDIHFRCVNQKISQCDCITGRHWVFGKLSSGVTLNLSHSRLKLFRLKACCKQRIWKVLAIAK